MNFHGVIVLMIIFPSDMNNLSNLRYLGSNRELLNFPEIGKLKFLQHVNGFNIKNENGYRIEELKLMNELGILGINNNLETERDAEEACIAKLCNKRKLMDLYLYWKHVEKRDNPDCAFDERVLDIMDLEALVDWFDASVVDNLFPCLTQTPPPQLPKFATVAVFAS